MTAPAPARPRKPKDPRRSADEIRAEIARLFAKAEQVSRDHSDHDYAAGLAMAAEALRWSLGEGDPV